jgi:hypothetical protein
MFLFHTSWWCVYVYKGRLLSQCRNTPAICWCLCWCQFDIASCSTPLFCTDICVRCIPCHDLKFLVNHLLQKYNIYVILLYEILQHLLSYFGMCSVDIQRCHFVSIIRFTYLWYLHRGIWGALYPRRTSASCAWFVGKSWLFTVFTFGKAHYWRMSRWLSVWWDSLFRWCVPMFLMVYCNLVFGSVVITFLWRTCL